MSNCPHIKECSYKVVNSQTEYYPEECYQCFDNQDLAQGVNLCLSCLNVGCIQDEARHNMNHSDIHFQKNPGHKIVLNVKRVEKPIKDFDGERSPKLAKLSIKEEEESDKYDIIYQPKCLQCKLDLSKDQDEKLKNAINAIENGTSSSKRNNIQAWEETRTSCEHVIGVFQMPDLPKITEGVKCEDCDFKNNLWLCLTCGNLGCGRKHYDGSGGNGHALTHFQHKGHPVCVKLGTITPEGSADIYCYHCDEEMVDPELSAHLKPFGINILEQTKTEKSMTELQLEHNIQFEFTMTSDDGSQLEPLSGPGYTGLKNLGNSCYFASTVQALFAIPEFKDRILDLKDTHLLQCTENPLECHFCQIIKMVDGIHSGRYSHLPAQSKSSELKPHQPGIQPTMMMKLFGKGHHEFSTMRQQDSFEYILHFLTLLERIEKRISLDNDGSQLFKFQLEEKIQCQTCRKVKYNVITNNSLYLSVPAEKDLDNEEQYKPVDLESCFEITFNEEILENYSCPNCRIPTEVTKLTRFLTYPKVLILSLQRFALVNWVPTKLEIPVKLPENNDLSDLLKEYQAKPHPQDEELMPDEEDISEEFQVDSKAVEQLMEMGFGENRCKRALISIQSNDVEQATAWLFEHMDDPDIDDPISASTKGFSPNSEQIIMLTSMGFPDAHAIAALKATQGNMDRAVEWIFNHPVEDLIESTTESTNNKKIGLDNVEKPFVLQSFISHKGTSVHTGHYVAHLKKEGQWILFNDNKVAAQPNPPIDKAYIYLFYNE